MNRRLRLPQGSHAQPPVQARDPPCHLLARDGLFSAARTLGNARTAGRFADIRKASIMGNLVAWTILVVSFVAANYGYLTF